MAGVKYLVHFRPDKKLAELISAHASLAIPSSGLHASLCFFQMDPGKEEEYKRQLSQLRFRQFSVETKGLHLYDNSSLVLELTKPSELHLLHTDVVNRSRWYAADKRQWSETKGKYYYSSYSPHITISKEGTIQDIANRYFFKDLIGVSFLVKEVFVSRKANEWSEILTVKGDWP